MPKIHLSGPGPQATVKRRLGKTNIGLYCDSCGEFFALAVSETGADPSVELTADELLEFECPLCHHQQHRQVTEIGQIHLTEATKRKPPPRSDLH